MHTHQLIAAALDVGLSDTDEVQELDYTQPTFHPNLPPPQRTTFPLRVNGVEHSITIDTLNELGEPEDPYRSLIRSMFDGWCLRKNSEEELAKARRQGKQDPDEVDFYLPFCGNDPAKAELLTLFDHWSNDILSIAGESFNLTTELIDGKWQVVDTPPRPEPLGDYYWSSGEFSWNDEDQTSVWMPGSWKLRSED